MTHLSSLTRLYAVGNVEVDEFWRQVHSHRQPVYDLHGVQTHLHAHQHRQIFIPLGQLNQP